MTADQLERKRRYNREWARKRHHELQQDPEYRARRAAAAKAWRQANPDRHRELQRDWAKRPHARAKTAARMREARSRGPDWDSRNREAVRKIKANAEAKRRAAKRTTEVEPIDRMLVYDRDRGLCGICGDPVDAQTFHVDHKIPLCKGGSHLYENVQVAHPRCNVRKGGSL